MVNQAEIIIVGAGPIGLELAVHLKRNGVDYIHLEAKQIGDTIANWPPQTQFFSAPERVALAGIPVHSPNQQSLTGEMYLSYLRGVVEQAELSIRSYEPVVAAHKGENGRFHLTTKTRSGKAEYSCSILILATGNMNRPRQLGIEGESLPHVAHRLRDPHDYFQKRLLIIGGKNSALEAALRCWRVGAEVALSYRRDAFETSIVKPHLSREIGLLIDKEQIAFYDETIPKRIEPGCVLLEDVDSGEETAVSTDFVLFKVGYEMEMMLYEQLGIQLEGKARKPQFDPNTMQTNVPNLYVCGTAAGGMEKEHELFISTCHEHVEKIIGALNLSKSAVGDVDARSYEISFDEIKED